MRDVAIQRRSYGRAILDYLDENRELVTIYGILLVIFILSSIASPTFRTPRNVFNVLRQAVALGLVSVGQTYAILSGGIDLSVGATISLVAVYTSGIMRGETGLMVPVILLGLGVAIVIGLVNGLVITRLRVPPFITTLGVASIIQGFVLLYAKAPIGKIAKEFRFFAEGYVGPIPFPVVFFALVAVVAWVILRLTVLGRYIYATGGSEEIARLSGIRTKMVITFTYVFCAFTAALSALFLTSRMGIGDPQVGGLNFDRYDLDSIAAVLIGGTRLGGGRGGVAGTVAGVLIVAILNNILNLLDVQTFWQWIIKGLIILAAVAIYARGQLTKGR
ncbi:MAG TPA: ABC transporter permease [Anaerolineae bacterium]|nr:ABC transporter permease [Anaerolineae bacterium]